MDIGSKEFPNKIIKWSAIVGGILLFHEIIFYGLFSSLEGLFLFVEYLENVENFFWW